MALSKHHGNHGNTLPITRDDEIRICADLCTSGLGGEGCGPVCKDLTPDIPRQSLNDSRNVKVRARQGVCPMLCSYSLGKPLCECENNKKNNKVDFKKICDFYCIKQNWLLRGCPDCEQNGVQKQNGRLMKMNYEYSGDIDWGKWCDVQCAQGNGGAACNCDILPFSMKVN